MKNWRKEMNSKSHPNFDAFVWSMWLLFMSRPRNVEPEPDGSYFIGDVGETPMKYQRLERETPYSVCKGIRGE